MLNRRFLRIKAFQTLYGFSREEGANALLYRKRMLDGLEKTYELYLYLLSFSTEFRAFLLLELDAEKSKHYPSEDQIKLIQLLAGNKAVSILQNSPSYNEALKKYKIHWNNQHELFRQIWNELKNMDLILNYFALPNHELSNDKDLMVGIIEWLCSDYEVFDAHMEERFWNWEDDQVLALTTLQKTFQLLKENSNKVLPEKHKDEAEDLKFVKNLFDLCVQNDAELGKLIEAKTKNWDQDRIALVDLILMKMALCEVLYFPYIPVKVSINEYLELAKLYSTPSSHGFINGILDKVQIELKKENRINKQGRGLVN